jgi:hypothetical protein
MSAQQERAAPMREEKPVTIEPLVKDGALVIREMTPADRRKSPNPTSSRPRRRRS